MTTLESGSSTRSTATTAGVIDQLFARETWITSGQVARLAGVSRQAAYNRLRAMAERGELIKEGERRGGRFSRPTFLTYHYELDGLDEAEAWAGEVAELRRRDLPILDNLKIEPLLNFTFTEMLNNAIDHSDGTTVEVRWYLTDSYIAFEIADDGVGAFANMAVTRGLESEFDAIGEIAKGRQTTDPANHSGLGIYFSSRMASRFVLTSGHLSWIVDGRRDDVAVEWLDAPRRGTLVRCEIDASTTTTQAAIFQAYAPAAVGAGQRATLRVTLFERGDDFVSRTEAKRFAAELESYGEVEVDFAGVGQVGQGFLDELFRVWQRAHPGTRLVAINTNPAIDALLRMTLG